MGVGEWGGGGDGGRGGGWTMSMPGKNQFSIVEFPPMRATLTNELLISFGIYQYIHQINYHVNAVLIRQL